MAEEIGAGDGGEMRVREAREEGGGGGGGHCWEWWRMRCEGGVRAILAGG